jgi:hypothetical protein
MAGEETDGENDGPEDGATDGFLRRRMILDEAKQQ